ncbi:MAG: CapA family protein [Patescibacteria group bacterium]
MKNPYFLIFIIIFIISAGLIIYFSQQYYPHSFSERWGLNTPNLSQPETPEISILLVGDIMLDRKVELLMAKNGFFYPFEKIVKLLNQSEGVFGNLEGPISKNPLNFSDDSLKFAFKSDVIEGLSSANFKILSLANNHTLNMGNTGLNETKTLLEEAGIDWVGDPWECSNKLSIKDNLVFLAFNKTFAGCKDENIIEIIKSIKDSAPDKFLIVSIHWGEEYKLKSNSAQQELAHKIIDSGGDLIFGHHPHVVQEIEKYNGKFIFYSLGNFIFDQYFSQETQEGLIIGLKIFPSKIVYELFPVESKLSQPVLMEKEKAKIFLEQLDVECKDLRCPNF